MKKNLVSLLTLLMAILLVSCENNDANDLDNNYWSCEQLLDTTGLKLYPFVPFTDEESMFTNYGDKLDRRQIPEDFLQEMTTKELFYQFVYTDLSKSMLTFNSRQQGFLAVAGQLNILPELLNRTDAGHVLLELLQKVDPAKINAPDCFWCDYCLQIILAQPEVINRMTDNDIDRYIHYQIRCHDTLLNLKNDYPANAALLLFCLGNVMIRYEFKPFIQTLEKNPDTNELIWDTQFINEQYALQIIDNIKKFKT